MKKIIFNLLILILIVFFACILSYNRCINYEVTPNPDNKVFSIKPGQGVEQIAANLKTAELIRSETCFNAYVWLNKKEAGMQAGDYEFVDQVSIKNLVAAFTAGETLSRERTLTFIEGWTSRDMDAYLAKEGAITAGQFSGIIKTPVKNWNLKIKQPDFLRDVPAGSGLEGFLFPDTYRVFQNVSAEEVVVKMLDNFDKKLTAQMRADIAKQNRTIFDIITMASVVEKEVRDKNDMKIVAGIFWDRIKNGQALESCASLAYILGVNKKQYTQEDTEIDSPYNTYRQRGLPPGPISNPGLNAITAAIYPTYTDYNYFLSSSEDGQTIYSKTYDEHLRNKAKYLK